MQFTDLYDLIKVVINVYDDLVQPNPLTRYPRHRENRENGQKNSLSGKTQGIGKFCQNTGNFVCSSCKFPDSKGKGYCDICRENFHFFPRSWIGLPSQFRLCNTQK